MIRNSLRDGEDHFRSAGLTSHQSRITSHVFIHLHCHSHYSFLRGVASPEEIIAAAKEQKVPAVALTDTNGMYAAVSFYKKALDAGIQPIVGVTLDVEWRVTSGEWREKAAGIARFARNDGSTHSISIVLLATDMEGYSNLCQLVTLRHLGTAKLAPNATVTAETDGRPVTLQELAERHRGVIALCPMPTQQQDTSNRRGTVVRAPAKKNQDNDGVREWIAKLKGIFADRLYIEILHLSGSDARSLREAERLGRELRLALIASNDSPVLKPEV